MSVVDAKTMEDSGALLPEFEILATISLTKAMSQHTYNLSCISTDMDNLLVFLHSLVLLNHPSRPTLDEGIPAKLEYDMRFPSTLEA